MKVKLNSYGALYLQRGNELRKVFCPYVDNVHHDTACGTWCALFSYSQEVVKTTIQLCNKEYISWGNDFEDESISKVAEE